MTRRFMWKRKLSQRAPACYYIASAFGIQRVVKHTNNQGAVGAGAKNGKHTPATFSFRNCPILERVINFSTLSATIYGRPLPLRDLVNFLDGTKSLSK